MKGKLWQWRAHRRHGRVRIPPGSPPGTLIPHPEAASADSWVLGYGPDALVERSLGSPAEFPDRGESAKVTWIHTPGLGETAQIEALGEHFDLHRLALEDVLTLHQRPKAEVYRDHLFVVVRLPAWEGTDQIGQLSLFLGSNWLLSFGAGTEASLAPVVERIRGGRGRIRGAGSDYLLYAILDAVIDGYFPVLERHGEALEALEDAVLARPDAQVVTGIHELKHGLLALRRAVWPLREVLNTLIRGDAPHVGEQARLYLRDCYDHVIQIMDIVETYREIASGLVDIYLSSQSARMNEIMKVLTIIATIFIPLGTIAGIYGMNFDPEVSPWNMPELGWRFGYPFALGIMATLAGALMLWFWRRGWLSNGRNGPT